jgi:hypothetical protein
LRWRSAIPLGLLVLCAGCGHYGFAEAKAPGHNRANSVVSDSVVSVWTIAAPADEGIDSARLTRALVGALERRGQAARWQADARGVSIRCSVSQSEVESFNETLFGRATVRCHVARADASVDDIEANGRYTASTGPGATALVAGHAQIQEAAALDALEAVADTIVRRGLTTE